MEKPLKRNTELKMTMKQTKELILIVEEDQDGDKSYQLDGEEMIPISKVNWALNAFHVKLEELKAENEKLKDKINELKAQVNGEPAW